MGIFSWIAVGLMVGFLASALSKSPGARRLPMLLVGVLGAMLGWLNVAFLYRVPGAMYSLNWIAAAAALVGAVFAVSLLGLLRPSRVTA